MRTRSSVWPVVGFALLTGAYSTLRAQQPKSVLDGIYTEAQAARGDKVYAASCATCHGPKLEGTTTAGPGLLGPDFINGWKDMSVSELLGKISMDMPSDAPATLTPEQYADVTAFVLSVNKYPAGPAELPADAKALKTVKMAAAPKP